MFKRKPNARGNPGRSTSAGSSFEHPQMTPDVYQRNGIAYKPSARASAAAIHSHVRPRNNAPTHRNGHTPASPEVDAARGGNVSQSRVLDNKSSSHSGLCCCLRSVNSFNKRNAKSKKNRCCKRNHKQRGKTQILRVYIQNQTQPGTKIRVHCPNRATIITNVPPRSEWLGMKSNGHPYFRLLFNPSAPSACQQTLPASAQSYASEQSVASDKSDALAQSNASECQSRCASDQSASSMACLPGATRTCNKAGRDKPSCSCQVNEISCSDAISGPKKERVPSIIYVKTSVTTKQGIGWECKACREGGDSATCRRKVY